MQIATSKTISVCQGELAVSGDADVMLTAVLGSCVATCLWDPVARLGGMNHILLPGHRDDGGADNRFGIFAMEALINELMKTGARKSNLIAKIFGGASTFENGRRIGETNALFVRDFLDVEGIPITAASTGGKQSRRVRFYPESGRARQMLTVDPSNLSLTRSGKALPHGKKPALPDAGSGQVELF